MIDFLEPVPAGPQGSAGLPLVRDAAVPAPALRLPRAPSVFDNEPDERGNPICPVCRHAIQPGEAVARWRTFLVHVTCLRAARERGDTDA